jgi:hypothetical protein
VMYFPFAAMSDVTLSVSIAICCHLSSILRGCR